ncbi:C39 family peptidase [Clostridium perfringens]|uniref:C39 family peptidase n=1 Tax=Clostridium perfringens TaxID=1502 RepID=UPI002ACC2ED7|nr:C39 family peptidase [Clostridium perfringens]
MSEFANLLGTKLPTGGTNFPGRWVSTMNKATNNKNNYQILRGPDYGITTWREKIKNSSIYTIDKGYPVIADCYIQSYEDRLHPSYNYATDTKHYVGIIGYDDRPQITPALLFIVDSNNRTTIPTTYWSEMNNVTYATDQFGIIW